MILKLLTDIIVLFFLYQLSKVRKNLAAALILFQSLSIVLDSIYLFGYSPVNYNEIVLIESFFLVGRTMIIVAIFSGFFKRFRPIYFSALYLIAASVLNVSFFNLVLILNVISHLLLILVFIYAHHSSHKYFRRAGFLGILYSITSIMLLMQYERYPSGLYLGQIFLAATYYYLKKSLENSKASYKRPSRYTNPVYSRMMVGFRIFAVSAIIVVIVLVTTISLHELGHALAARYFGCRLHKAVIYDGTHFPHTEVICETDSNNILIAAAGILLPIIFGMLLLLLGERSLTGAAYLMLGFSFHFSSNDLEHIIFTQTVPIMLLILSIFFLVLGMREEIYFVYEEEDFKTSLIQ